jgi:hypothetical protein
VLTEVGLYSVVSGFLHGILQVFPHSSGMWRSVWWYSYQQTLRHIPEERAKE